MSEEITLSVTSYGAVSNACVDDKAILSFLSRHSHYGTTNLQ